MCEAIGLTVFVLRNPGQPRLLVSLRLLLPFRIPWVVLDAVTPGYMQALLEGSALWMRVDGAAATWSPEASRANHPSHTDVNGQPTTTGSTAALPVLPAPSSNHTHRNEKGGDHDNVNLMLYIGVGMVAGGVAGLLLLRLFRICLSRCNRGVYRRNMMAMGARYDGDDANVVIQHNVKVLLASIPVQSYKKLMGCPKNRQPCRPFTPQEEPCAICLDDLQKAKRARQLPCGHIFHSRCVDPWVIQRHTCPLCVASVLSHSSNGDVHSDSDTLLNEME